MRQIKFENHRKKKLQISNFISVITKDGKIENGWTNGRNEEEINIDFGIKNIDWFIFRHKAEEYIIKNKNKYIGQ